MTSFRRFRKSVPRIFDFVKVILPSAWSVRFVECDAVVAVDIDAVDDAVAVVVVVGGGGGDVVAGVVAFDRDSIAGLLCAARRFEHIPFYCPKISRGI